MNRDEFAYRFHAALTTAAEDAEQRLGRAVPRRFRVLLHGADHSGDLMAPDAALDELYLGSDRSYLVIDVGVVEVDPDNTTVFVRASGHRPGPYDQMWNDPPGTGPFKRMGMALNAKVVET